MKILLINHYAGSQTHGMSFRAYYLAREWLKLGHEVKIVASSFSHLRTKNPVVKGSMLEENIDGVDYCWLRAPKYYGNGVGRIFNIVCFLFRLFFNKSKIVRHFKPDIVVASSTYPLDNYLAYNIAKKTGAKYVYELHDLWPLSPMEIGGYSKYHPYILLMGMAEKFACKKCDYIVSILPKTKDYLVSKGLSENKFLHVPNGIFLDDSNKTDQLPGEISRKIEEKRKEGVFIVGYAGGLAESNAMSYLLEAAYLLRNDNVHFFIAGDGVQKADLGAFASERNMRNITFLGKIDKKYVNPFLMLMDSLFLGWHKCSLYRFGISPNKVFDYMYAGRPIIHSVSAGNDPVKEAGCGISVEAEDPAAIADAIRRLMAMPCSVIERLGANGKKYVIRNHDYKILAEKFMCFVQSLVS